MYARLQSITKLKVNVLWKETMIKSKQINTEKDKLHVIGTS